LREGARKNPPERGDSMIFQIKSAGEVGGRVIPKKRGRVV